MSYYRYAAAPDGTIEQGNYDSDGEWVGKGPDPRTIPKPLVPLSAEDIDIHNRFPAVTSRGRFYLIQNNGIIGVVRMASGRSGIGMGTYESVSIEADDDATRAFFKDDVTMTSLGGLYGLRYDGYTGRPIEAQEEEYKGRHKETEIVDTLDFDFGIAHPRFAAVKGWSVATKRTHLKVNTVQKHRRPRSSNKIRKVG